MGLLLSSTCQTHWGKCLQSSPATWVQMWLNSKCKTSEEGYSTDTLQKQPIPFIDYKGILMEIIQAFHTESIWSNIYKLSLKIPGLKIWFLMNINWRINSNFQMYKLGLCMYRKVLWNIGEFYPSACITSGSLHKM